jgi:hypothetical protein
MESQQKLDKQLPNEVAQFGQPLAEHGRSLGGLFSQMIFGVIGVGMIAFAVAGQVKDIALYQRALGLFVGGFGVFIAVSGIRKFMEHRNTRIQVFADGLAVISDTGTKIFRWDDIKSVIIEYTKDESVQSMFIKPLMSISTWIFGVWSDENIPTFNVELKDKTILTFSQDIRDHKKLGDTILKEATNRLLPVAIEAFDKGETVTFYKFNVSQQGFAEGNKTVTWDQVKGITVDKDSATLNGAAKTIPVTTPNYNVLLGLINHALKPRL